MGTRLFTRIMNRLRRRHHLAEYQVWLLAHGRITEGRILDAHEDEAGVTIFYSYHISNVQYESSQSLTPEQRGHGHRYAPGATVTVRFDPRHPGRSLVQ